jgi:hypothetical protein
VSTSAVRWGAIAVSSLAVLGGALLMAAAFTGHRGPVDWLDRNLERTGSGAGLSQEPVVATADRIADATSPANRVTDTWGVALRYGNGTVTVVPGPRAGTANVYWDGRRSGRRYVYGRYGWARSSNDDGGGGGGASRSAFTQVDAPDPGVQTRRGEDFRGGGPGSGK